MINVWLFYAKKSDNLHYAWMTIAVCFSYQFPPAEVQFFSDPNWWNFLMRGMKTPWTGVKMWTITKITIGKS